MEADHAHLTPAAERLRQTAARYRSDAGDQPRADFRDAVSCLTRTLRGTIERVAASAPRAAAHLRASVRTGGACRYEPAPGGPSRWHL